MEKIRIAQIGTEHDHASEAFHTLRLLDDVCEVAGFCLIDEDGSELYEERKKRYDGCPRLSLEEILLDPSIGAVTVETSDRLLTKYALLALERGKAVQMDKPGSADQASFEAICDLAAAKGLPLQLGYMYRFNPVLTDLYRRIEAGEFGEILYVDAEMNCLHGEKKRRWLGGYPGGMMYFLGCHLVDIVYRIQGEPLDVTPMNAASGEDGVDSLDQGLALFCYPKGVSLVRTTCVERGGYMRRQIVVVGTKGTCEIRPTEYFAPEPEGIRDLATDYRCAFGTRFHDDAPFVRSPLYHRYEAMLRFFCELAAGRAENPYTPEYEKALHRLLLKACGES